MLHISHKHIKADLVRRSKGPVELWKPEWCYRLSSPGATLLSLHSSAHNSLSSATQIWAASILFLLSVTDRLTHLIFLGNEAVHDEPLQLQLSAQLADVLKLLNFSVVLFLKVGHLTNNKCNRVGMPVKREVKDILSAAHSISTSHQHEPHFFQFLGFFLSFLLQTCVFLFYVQASLPVIKKKEIICVLGLLNVFLVSTHYVLMVWAQYLWHISMSCIEKCMFIKQLVFFKVSSPPSLPVPYAAVLLS